MGYSSKSQISACTSLEPFLSKYAQTTEGPFWVSRSSSLIPIATRYASRRLSILWLGTIRKRTPPTSCLFKVILATTEEPNHYLLATNQKTISTPSASHSETHRKYWNTLVKPNHYTSPIYQQYSTTNHLFERMGTGVICNWVEPQQKIEKWQSPSPWNAISVSYSTYYFWWRSGPFLLFFIKGSSTGGQHRFNSNGREYSICKQVPSVSKHYWYQHLTVHRTDIYQRPSFLSLEPRKLESIAK